MFVQNAFTDVATSGVGKAKRGVMRYTREVIRSFRHSGLEKFFNTGSKSGIQPAHEKKLRLQLTTLNSAVTIGDVAKFEAWSLHPLKGEMAGKWAISVNGNWRIVFEFDGTDVWVVDYRDYH